MKSMMSMWARLPSAPVSVATIGAAASRPHTRTGPVSESIELTIEEGQKITVILPTEAQIDDPQVTHVKIFIRQHGTMAEFFLVVDGTTPAIDETFGWPVGQDVVDIDVEQDSLTVFRLIAAAENDNYPPPESARFIVTTAAAPSR